MTRRTLAIDAASAVLIAALALILGPGLAIVAVAVILVVIACAISVILDAMPRRRPRTGKRRGR
jgi:hypothetical protein